MRPPPWETASLHPRETAVPPYHHLLRSGAPGTALAHAPRTSHSQEPSHRTANRCSWPAPVLSVLRHPLCSPPHDNSSDSSPPFPTNPVHVVERKNSMRLPIRISKDPLHADCSLGISGGYDHRANR